MTKKQKDIHCLSMAHQLAEQEKPFCLENYIETEQIDIGEYEGWIKANKVKQAIKNFLEDIKTICPNTLFNKEVEEKSIKHFGASLTK